MITRRYLYKVEAVEKLRVTLNVARVFAAEVFPPAPRLVLSGILTGWRMLYTGLGYHDLPITLEEAHNLYRAAPTYERLATLYANYCPHNEQNTYLNYLRTRTGLRKTMWTYTGRFFRGGREWVAWHDKSTSYGLLSAGHVYDHKTNIRDETESLLLELEATQLEGAGLPAARISFTAGEAALIQHLRPGMVWEYTDEYECPHCLSNAVYQETGCEKRIEMLTSSTGERQLCEIDLRQCQCSLCGGAWKEDHSFYVV